MAQKIPLILQLKYILLKRHHLVDFSESIAQYLLFPLVCWFLLWCVFRLSTALNWSTNLIGTFCLPLLTLFVVYRLVALLIHLFMGQEMYTVLVKRFLFPLFVTYALLQYVRLFIDLSLLGDTELFTIAKTSVTLRSFFVASVGLYFWFAGVSGLAQSLRKLLLKQMKLDEGTLDASLILLRYFLISLGLFVVFSELKLDSTAIAAISGGLAVGIGFGLKDIVINFISGIMLLFERTLRPGDIIEVDNKMGRVEEINLRATTIKTNDHIEIVIPNQIFLNSTLTSYTRRSRMARFQLEIPVGYEHSPETITAILLDAIRDDAKISTRLTSKVDVTNFDRQGILYKLQVWTEDPMAIASIRNNIYRRVWKALVEHGIELNEPVDISIHNPLSLETLTQLPTVRFKTPESPALHEMPPRLNIPRPAKPSQVDLVESSFEKIKPHASEFTASFYRNLFRNDPKIRPLFKETDMEKQQGKLMSALVLLVGNVRDPDHLIPILQDLGARHKGYGVIEKYYPAVGSALLETFEQYLKKDWTPDVKQAWVDTFEAITQIMLEGAATSH